MPYKLVRTEQEINDLLNQACEIIDEKGTEYPGMSYEEGIIQAIGWLTDLDCDDEIL